MRIRSIKQNNRRRAFEVRTWGQSFAFPYAKADPPPSAVDPIVELWIDDELGREGFTYRLVSGREGSVHIDHVLEYNQDPKYMRDLLLHKLTIEARNRIAASSLSKREIIRRLGTSPAQLYRLLDPTNYRKSVDRLLLLLSVLECDVDLIVRDRSRTPRKVYRGTL